MNISEYFKNISDRFNSESNELRLFFSTHRPSAGSNREGLVADFLRKHLPSKYEISHGLVFSSEGEFSNQADVLVCDALNNAPLFRDRKEPIWLVESIYALVEVKTTISPSELDDCIAKCQKFKSLKRRSTDRNLGRIRDSLFVVWAFEGPSSTTFRDTIVDKFAGLAIEAMPDFIVVPGKYVCMSGQYRALARLGQPFSLYHQQLNMQKELMDRMQARGFEIAVLNEHSLLATMVWITSWLQQAGERYASLVHYLPEIMESQGDYEHFT